MVERAYVPEGSRISTLSLRAFRTYARLELELQPGLTAFCGPNGIGKTNLVEALAMSCAGASPRTSSEFRVIREGSTFARIVAGVEIADRPHQRVVRVEAGAGKRLEIDGSVVRGVDEFASSLPAVTFLPERLLVVRGAPSRRRALLDRCVMRMLPRATADFRQYAAAMAQRNNLLRRAKGGAEVRTQIQPWSEQMVEAGTAMREHRRVALAQLGPRFTARFAELTEFDDGALDLEQRGGDDINEALSESWSHDVRRGTTTVGPHLDDLTYRQGARDLRTHGSTGEQRAALLAWSLADADSVTAITGTAPLLVFDEPYAELDQHRRRLLTAALLELPQVFVTTTEPPQHLVDRRGAAPIDLRRVSSGEVHAWTSSFPT